MGASACLPEGGGLLRREINEDLLTSLGSIFQLGRPYADNENIKLNVDCIARQLVEKLGPDGVEYRQRILNRIDYNILAEGLLNKNPIPDSVVDTLKLLLVFSRGELRQKLDDVCVEKQKDPALLGQYKKLQIDLEHIWPIHQVVKLHKSRFGLPCSIVMLPGGAIYALLTRFLTVDFLRFLAGHKPFFLCQNASVNFSLSERPPKQQQSLREQNSLYL